MNTLNNPQKSEYINGRTRQQIDPLQIMKNDFVFSQEGLHKDFRMDSQYNQTVSFTVDCKEVANAGLPLSSFGVRAHGY